MKEIFKPFSELTPRQVMDLFYLRQKVFVIEQQCFYEDIDGADPSAYHLLLYSDDILSAYLRYFAPGLKFEEACLGRIVVHPDFRGGILGETLIESAINFSKKNYPKSSIRIEAQAGLIRYYNKFGFKEEGEIYIVDEIEHIQMVLK